MFEEVSENGVHFNMVALEQVPIERCGELGILCRQRGNLLLLKLRRRSVPTNCGDRYAFQQYGARKLNASRRSRHLANITAHEARYRSRCRKLHPLLPHAL